MANRFMSSVPWESHLLQVLMGQGQPPPFPVAWTRLQADPGPDGEIESCTGPGCPGLLGTERGTGAAGMLQRGGQGRTPGSWPVPCVVSEKSMTPDLLTGKGGVTSPPC